MNILIAVDDSKFSEAAVNAVMDHMKMNDTEVKLLRVLEPFPAALAKEMGSKNDPDFGRACLKLQDQATEALAKTAEQFRSAGFKASVSVEEGDPRRVILDYAERWPADLIVLGSHGRKGINLLLMGSVSEAVSRYARCSVQIARIRSDH
jgi:nucleotide-binding universal stress UspA family protein